MCFFFFFSPKKSQLILYPLLILGKQTVVILNVAHNRHNTPSAAHFAKSALLRAHVGSTYLNVFQMSNALFKRLTLELCSFKGEKKERVEIHTSQSNTHKQN